MKVKTGLRFGCATAVLALALTACSSGGDTPSTPGANDGPGTESPGTERPETVEGVLEAVRELDPEAREAQLLEWAQEEDGFVWYAALQAESADAISAAYRAAYPEVNMTVNGGKGGGAMFEQVIGEAQANQDRWDVLIANPEHIGTLREMDLPAKYDGPALEQIPEEYRDPNGHWVDFYIIRMVMIYNTNVVPADKVPTSYEDLADPYWAGKFVVDTEDFEWSAYIDANWPGLLEQLAAQEPIAIRGGGTIRESVTSGEIPLGVSVGDYLVYGMIEDDGAPVEMVYAEPALVKHGPMLLAKQAPNPANAVLFFDWAISAEGQTAMNESTKRAFVNSEATESFPGLAERYEKVGSFFPTDVENLVANYDAIIDRHVELFVN